MEDERAEEAVLCPRTLIRENRDTIATAMFLEQGKTFIVRHALFLHSNRIGYRYHANFTQTPKTTSSGGGLQVIETTCAIPTPPWARIPDTETRTVPLGCVTGAGRAGWSLSERSTSRSSWNTLLIKPSDRDPGVTMIIVELCVSAGHYAPMMFDGNNPLI
ncbi:hypothetical protein K438DRAFT_1997958 [Mycena galopus ATCC 62051]|nr:hypothetical protein K438DRAFT_1997958 [Mycena galopus ATCC 62051]